MSILTDVLKLFKYNTTTDGEQTFNMDTGLNENWDKIDNFAKNVQLSGVFYEELEEDEITITLPNNNV